MRVPKAVPMGVQLLAAAALVVWRLATSRRPFPLDLLLLLSLYWIYCVFFVRARHWPAVTLLLTFALSWIYLRGQMPHMLDQFDLLP